MYHYTASGLDNLFLVNGYAVKETSRGAAVTVDDIEALHRAIGVHLATRRKRLDGREARFLRHEMGYSQAQLARLIGKEAQSIARWEKKRIGRAETLPADSERLLRYLYLEHAGCAGSMAAFLEGLSELAEADMERLSFLETENGWRSAA